MTRARTADRAAAPRAPAPQGAQKPAGAERPAAAPKPGGAAPGKNGEHVQVLSTAPITEESTTYLRPVLEQSADVVGSAVGPTEDEERAAREAAEIKPVQYAIVVRGGTYLDRQGNRTLVKAGKEVDSQNFDFGRMQRSSIMLRLIKPEERGQFIPELAAG